MKWKFKSLEQYAHNNAHIRIWTSNKQNLWGTRRY